ncbi:MAG: hypothetical protein IJQ89_06480 [Bacteroidales bacterium]|nr:hypothetical protein [Bacteroidales bacterium]
MRGSDNGGLVNIESLKNYLDEFKNAVSHALEAIGAGPEANGATGRTAFDTAMQRAAEDLQTLEDPTITH